MALTVFFNIVHDILNKPTYPPETKNIHPPKIIKLIKKPPKETEPNHKKMSNPIYNIWINRQIDTMNIFRRVYLPVSFNIHSNNVF